MKINVKARTGYFSIGGVPVKENNNYKVIFPLFKNYEEIIEDNSDFSLNKIYKNEYLLYSKFYNKETLQLENYYDYFKELIIDINHIYVKRDLDLFNEETSKVFLERREVKDIEKLYNINLTNVIEELYNNAKESHNYYLEDDNCTFKECLLEEFSKKIDSLLDNINNNNINLIYAIQSLLNYDFINLYVTLYNYSCLTN